MNKILIGSLISLILISCTQDGPNIKQLQNLQFFIDNKIDTEIIEIEPGLQYKILQKGSKEGKFPELDEVIVAHFHGTLTNGEVFWSSLETQPLEIELSKLIIGCQKIISKMHIGDKWIVYIDPSMAYGEEGRPGIPSNSILVFEIELLEIKN